LPGSGYICCLVGYAVGWLQVVFTLYMVAVALHILVTHPLLDLGCPLHTFGYSCRLHTLPAPWIYTRIPPLPLGLRLVPDHVVAVLFGYTYIRIAGLVGYLPLNLWITLPTRSQDTGWLGYLYTHTHTHTHPTLVPTPHTRWIWLVAVLTPHIHGLVGLVTFTVTYTRLRTTGLHTVAGWVAHTFRVTHTHVHTPHSCAVPTHTHPVYTPATYTHSCRLGHMVGFTTVALPLQFTRIALYV